MNGNDTRSVDLLSGNIFRALITFATPLMLTALLQTAYSLTDMAWIGRAGSGAVAAVGAASMFSWLSNSFVMLARMGGQVKVAQSYGENDPVAVEEYGRGALQLTVLIAAVIGILANLIPGILIGFFRLNSVEVFNNAVLYLRIACGLVVFSLTGMTLTGLYTASGDSRTPFLANCSGLIINMILDPVFIFGLGPVPSMGVIGAALATVTAQIVVCVLLIFNTRRYPLLSAQIKIWRRTPLSRFRTIVQIGFPSALQQIIYSGISIILTRFITAFGDTAIAVQRLGTQIESLSWMAADGFGSAVNAFIGQNYGAGDYTRVKKGYNTAAVTIGAWGLFASAILIFGAVPLFSFFISEPDVIPMGAAYLRIIGYGEVFLCIEYMTVGAMSGMGKTREASVISIILTGARIPLALILSATSLGLDGVWWALTISSMSKGIVFFIAFKLLMRRFPQAAVQ